jgi:hypothetical protein
MGTYYIMENIFFKKAIHSFVSFKANPNFCHFAIGEKNPFQFSKKNFLRERAFGYMFEALFPSSPRSTYVTLVHEKCSW